MNCLIAALLQSNSLVIVACTRTASGVHRRGRIEEYALFLEEPPYDAADDALVELVILFRLTA